jgi:molybdate transport system ATP-binding protein
MDRLDIAVRFARRRFDLRIELKVGDETCAVIGPSGSGKTTLLRLVAGLDHPDDGRIVCGSQTWFDGARGVRRRPEERRVGYVPQDYGLFPHLTVAANVAFAARRARPDLLDQLRIAALADARPGEISGGERQRVALARALARDPQILLLDEPLAALDAATRDHVRAELRDILADLGVPTLLVTHAFEDANALAGRCIVLDAGRVVQSGTPVEVRSGPASPVVARLTGANVIGGVAAAHGSGCRIALRGGGDLAAARPASGPVVIAIAPWALRIVEASGAPVSDRVIDIRDDGPTLRVRTERFVVDMPRDAETVPVPGSTVGLQSAPEGVHVFLGGTSYDEVIADTSNM